MRAESNQEPSRVAKDVERLIYERFQDGLVRRLEVNFGPVGVLAEDAVSEGVSKVLTDGERLGVRDVPDYVTGIAFNAVRRDLKRRQREELYDDVPEPVAFEDDADAKALFAALVELIRRVGEQEHEGGDEARHRGGVHGRAPDDARARPTC